MKRCVTFEKVFLKKSSLDLFNPFSPKTLHFLEKKFQKFCKTSLKGKGAPKPSYVLQNFMLFPIVAGNLFSSGDMARQSMNP